MATNWTAFFDGLRAAAAAVWTDTPTAGIWTAARIERIPLEEIDVPFSVIVRSPARETDEYGITNQSYLLDVTWYYVFQIDQVSDYEETAAAKAEALEDYLLVNDPAGGQVIRITQQDVTPDDPVMMLFLDKAKPFYAGAVTAQVLVGETN